MYGLSKYIWQLHTAFESNAVYIINAYLKRKVVRSALERQNNVVVIRTAGFHSDLGTG